MKTQQLEIKLTNKTEEEIKKARRKSTQAGEYLDSADECVIGDSGWMGVKRNLDGIELCYFS